MGRRKGKYVRNFACFNPEDVKILFQYREANKHQKTYFRDEEGLEILNKISSISYLLSYIPIEIRMDIPQDIAIDGIALWWKPYTYKIYSSSKPTNTWALQIERSDLFLKVSKISTAELKILAPTIEKFLSFAVEFLKKKEVL